MSVEDRAVKMAREKATKWFRTVDAYNITDNPCCGKRDSVTWHNAFYDECRKLGRRIK